MEAGRHGAMLTGDGDTDIFLDGVCTEVHSGSQLQESSDDYLRNYELLRAKRDGDRTASVMLPPMEQWALFCYYLPHESHGREELLEHRQEIIEPDPELPRQAKEALQEMRRIAGALPAYREQAKSQPHAKKNTKKRIVIFSEVNPELDPERFAQILVHAGLEQARREKLAREGKLACSGTCPRVHSRRLIARPHGERRVVRISSPLVQLADGVAHRQPRLLRASFPGSRPAAQQSATARVQTRRVWLPQRRSQAEVIAA